MRRLSILVLLAGLLAIPARASASPPISASEFATKCSTGTYIVGSDLAVRGGTGTFTGDCLIVLAEGVTLTFSNLTFDDVGGGCCFLVVGDSLRDTAIGVRNATIDLEGAVQLAAGCCAGDGEPLHPEENGLVDVKRSSIRGTTVELSGSTADDDGTVRVRNSTLEATDTSAFAMNLRASVPAERGHVDVRNSTLVSAGDILVNTDVDGLTVARNNTFAATGAVTITTGAGGTCVSSGNTPPVACT